MKRENQISDSSSEADWLIGGGETGELIRAVDWSKTPLGPRAAWPQSLRFAANLVVATSFPMAILWGKDLIFLYNDAYRTIAGGKHPQAMGRSTREVWPEVWEFNKPVFEKVMTRGETIHLEGQLFRITRRGRVEDAFFTLSYSPIRTDDGPVGGTLVTLIETTRQVESHRQSTSLLEAISDSTGDVIFAKDRQGRITYANPATLALIGKPLEQVLGRTDAEFLDDKTAARRVMDNDRRIMDRGQTEELEEAVPLPDGTQRVWWSRKTPYRDAEGKVVGLLGVSRDITERKRAEEVMRASEAEHRSMAENVPCVLMRYNRQLQVVYLSPQAEQVTGLRTERFLGRTNREVGMPEDLCALWESALQRVFSTGAKESVEFSFPSPEGSRTFLLKLVPEFAADGHTIAHVLGVSTDITEGKRKEEALRQGEEKYRSLFENMSEGFGLHEVICDGSGKPVDWRFLEINPAFERLTGLKREQVIGQTHSELLPGDDPKWLDIYGRVALTGEPAQFENYSPALQRHYEVVAFRPAAGQFATLFIDITERKRAEEALRASEERHRLLAQTMLQGVVHQSADGTIVSMNPAAERILGKTHQEFVGSSSVQEERHTIREDGSPFPGLEHPAMVALRTGQPVRDVVMGVFNPREKAYRWISIDAVPVFREGQPKPHEVYTMFADITERKAAEQALHTAHARLKAMFEHSAVGLVLFDAEPPYRVLAVNRYYEQLWPEPWPSHGLVGRPLTDFAPGVEEAGIAEVFRQVVDTRKGAFIPNTPYDHMVGGRRWWNWTLEPVIENGRVVALAHLAVEVTTQIQARQQIEVKAQALQQSEARLRLLLSALPVGVHIAEDAQCRVITSNPAAARMFEAAPETNISASAPEPPPNRFYHQGRELTAGEMPMQTALREDREVNDVEIEAHLSSGRRWTALVNATPLHGPDGQVVGGVATLLDITDRKRAEAARRESEERFRIAQELSPDGFLIFRPLRDAGGKVTDFAWVYENDAAARMNNTDPRAVLGTTLLEILPNHDKSPFHRAYKEVAETGQGRVVEEAFYAGDTFQKLTWFRVVAIPTAGGDVAVLAQDITARRQTEAALRENEERLRLATEGVDMGIWDLDLRTGVANRTLRHDQIFGYQERQPLWTLDIALQHVLPEDRAAIAEAYALAQKTGKLFHESRVRWPDGTIHWISARGRMHLDPQGQPVRIAGVVTDITERKAVEQEQAATVELLEMANHARTPRELARAAIGFFAKLSGCAVVGLRLREGENYPYYDHQGMTDEFLCQENGGKPYIACMCGNVLCGRTDPRHPFFTRGGSFWTNSTTHLLATTTAAERQAETRNVCNKVGWESLALIPLRLGDETFGLLHLADRQIGKFSAEMIARFERLALQFSTGLGKLLAEEASRQSRAKLEAALASMTDAVFISDAQGRFIDFNDAFATFHRFRNKAECLKTFAEYPDILDVYMADGTLAPVKMWAVPRALRGEVVSNAEYGLRRKDTGERWVGSYSFAPIRDKDGAIVGSVVVGRETTEQKRAAEELQAAKAAAEAASRAKDQFIAVLSHELRTPLSPAVAALQLLRRDVRLPHDVREDLDIVASNIDLEVRLIADLLDVSRIISGKLHLEKRAVDVADAIQEAARIVSGDLDAKGQTLTIETRGAPYLAFADAARLQQVFWNLLRNSIKFSPARSRIIVRARLISVDHCPLATQPCPVGKGECPLPQAGAGNGNACEGNLIVEVIDQGSGIDPEMLLRLFNAFEQEQKARSFGGLGLGLSICKAVVEMHGGTIAAYSAGTGQGSTFTIRLPVAQCPLSIASEPLPHGQGAVVAEAPQSGSRCLKILLVEDHADTAKLMRRLLKVQGHQVTLATNVAEGVAAAQQETPDVLISDLGLPDGTGLDLMQQLLAQGHRIPAIALSGYGTAADIEKSKAAGFAEHLVKPLGSIELLAAAIARLGICGGGGKKTIKPRD